jgi:methylated-DNA-[protein]-cysteine S-methyltransferase|tara:strand:- start:911 stop:1213 length:303 start_codon:yes stop_codon:yes gene_type:complete
MNFNQKVLELTKRVPKGKVTTYKILADKLGTKAYRAVGTALKNNKHPVTIPCHRIVSHNGSLGGYKGKMNSPEKIRLLKKEGVDIKNNKIKEFEKVLFKF